MCVLYTAYRGVDEYRILLVLEGNSELGELFCCSPWIRNRKEKKKLGTEYGTFRYVRSAFGGCFGLVFIWLVWFGW